MTTHHRSNKKTWAFAAWAFAALLVAGQARATPEDPAHYNLSNKALAKYQHQKWMPPKQRQAFMRYFVMKAGLPKVSPRAWQKLVAEFPTLRGLNPENVRLASADDARLPAMLGALGKQIPLLGYRVFTYDGHPYLITHQSGANGSNTTNVWDTTFGTFHDGSRIKYSSLTHVTTKKDMLYFLYAAPGDVARSIGDEVAGWKNDPNNDVHKNGWPCTHFLTSTLRHAGDKLPDDPNNPFKNVWGVPSWEANARHLGSAAVGARSVLSKSTSAPDLVLLTLQPKRYRELMAPGARVSPEQVPELSVPKQAEN